MPTVPIEPAEKSPRFRVPSVGVLIVLGGMLLLGAALITWWTARSGIRRVKAIGSRVFLDENPVSHFVSDYIKIDYQLLSTDRDVEAVALYGPQVDDQFVTVLQRFPNVVSVHLEETMVTDRALAELVSLTQITSLRLYDSPGVTDAGIAELGGLPNLQDLRTENLPITGAGLSLLTHLEILDIAGCKTLEPTAIRELGRLPNLNFLGFTKSRLTDEGLRGIAGAPTLEWLNLDSTDITDASLSFIVEQLPNLGRLSLSDLDGITDEGVRQLAALKKLGDLTIHGSNISEETVKTLRKALPGRQIYIGE